MGRAMRIRTECSVRRKPTRSGNCRSGSCRRRGFGLGKLYAELLKYLSNYFVVELRAVPLLEHGKRRLLAAYLGCKHALRETRRTACLLGFPAYLWTKICHAYYYGLYLPKTQGRVINSYQPIYQLLNSLLIILFISLYLDR